MIGVGRDADVTLDRDLSAGDASAMAGTRVVAGIRVGATVVGANIVVAGIRVGATVVGANIVVSTVVGASFVGGRIVHGEGAA
jgi:hypothetical protein